MRSLILSFLLLFVLHARENPFFPSSGEKDMFITSNENRKAQPLKRAAITLPSQARVLQRVTLEYKNLDGSLESKSVELNNAVDWHLPVFISQSYLEPQKNTEIQAKTKQKEQSYEKIASIKYLSLYISGKKLKVVTSDKIIRDFMLVNPHRIVIDFKRDTTMKSYVKEITNGIFQKVRIGNHKGYYRAVIKLDGVYRYRLKKSADGYLIELI